MIRQNVSHVKVTNFMTNKRKNVRTVIVRARHVKVKRVKIAPHVQVDFFYWIMSVFPAKEIVFCAMTRLHVKNARVVLKKSLRSRKTVPSPTSVLNPSNKNSIPQKKSLPSLLLLTSSPRKLSSILWNFRTNSIPGNSPIFPAFSRSKLWIMNKFITKSRFINLN